MTGLEQIVVTGCPTCGAPAQAIAEGEGVRYRYVDTATLRQNPERGVTEAMDVRAEAKRMHAEYVASVPAGCGVVGNWDALVPSAKLHWTEQAADRIIAALSAEPAAQGEAVVEDGASVLQRLGDDAAKWAAEFRATALRLGYSDMDEEWLIGWFANAIEHSGDVRRWREEAAPPAQPAERVPPREPNMTMLREGLTHSYCPPMTAEALSRIWTAMWDAAPAERVPSNVWPGDQHIDMARVIAASPAPSESEGGKGVDDTFARELYIASQCDAHNLHTLAWHELTEKQRDEWRKKATGAAR